MYLIFINYIYHSRNTCISDYSHNLSMQVNKVRVEKLFTNVLLLLAHRVNANHSKW